MPSFTFEVINNKKCLCYNGNQYVYKNPLRDSSLLYKCVHPSCSATIKLDKSKTEITDGTFTHARHSPLNPRTPRVSGVNTGSRNSTPVTSRPTKGLYLPCKSPSSTIASLSSSPDSEFRTPCYKPPREDLLSVDRRRVSTSPLTIHSQSPVSESKLIDNHDQRNASSVPSGHSSTILFNDSNGTLASSRADSETVILKKKIEDLLRQRDSLIDKIQELTINPLTNSNVCNNSIDDLNLTSVNNDKSLDSTFSSVAPSRPRKYNDNTVSAIPTISTNCNTLPDRSNRTSCKQSGGGALLAIDNSFPTHQIPLQSDNVEQLFVRVSLPDSETEETEEGEQENGSQDRNSSTLHRNYHALTSGMTDTTTPNVHDIANPRSCRMERCESRRKVRCLKCKTYLCLSKGKCLSL
ncbi:hypothetical protein WDU94_015352 [Cyamophila willieti]